MKPCQTARLYVGNRGAENRVDRRFEQGADREGGHDADHETSEHEKLDGKAHQERRLMRRARQALPAAGRKIRRG